jgi:hypothetical protein
MTAIYPADWVIQFGGLAFTGRGTPLSAIGLEQAADTALIPTTSYPFDIRGGQPGPLKDSSFSTSVLLKAGAGKTGLAAYSDVESQFAAILSALQGTYTYAGGQVSGQVGQLVVLRADGVSYAGAWARIAKVELALLPGQHTYHYLLPLTWTLLSDFTALSGAPVPPASTPASVVVPFGRVVSHAGIALGGDGLPVKAMTWEWQGQYNTRAGDGRYPFDLRGVSACPLKTPTATWETSIDATAGLYGRAAYTSVENQLNTMLSGLAATPQGALVVRKADNVATMQCTGRLTKPELALAPGRNVHSVTLPLTFDLLSSFS